MCFGLLLFFFLFPISSFFTSMLTCMVTFLSPLYLRQVCFYAVAQPPPAADYRATSSVNCALLIVSKEQLFTKFYVAPGYWKLPIHSNSRVNFKQRVLPCLAPPSSCGHIGRAAVNTNSPVVRRWKEPNYTADCHLRHRLW